MPTCRPRVQIEGAQVHLNALRDPRFSPVPFTRYSIPRVGSEETARSTRARHAVLVQVANSSKRFNMGRL